MFQDANPCIASLIAHCFSKNVLVVVKDQAAVVPQDEVTKVRRLGQEMASQKLVLRVVRLLS